jgi:hypothetical protein
MKQLKRKTIVMLVVSILCLGIFPTIALGKWEEPTGGLTTYASSYSHGLGIYVSGSLGNTRVNDGVSLTYRDDGTAFFFVWNEISLWFYFPMTKANALFIDFKMAPTAYVKVRVYYEGETRPIGSTYPDPETLYANGFHIIDLDSTKSVWKVNVLFQQPSFIVNPVYTLSVDYIALY